MTDVTKIDSFPFFSIAHKEGYTESETETHDKEATKYLAWIGFPLIIGYTLYSLFYNCFTMSTKVFMHLF